MSNKKYDVINSYPKELRLIIRCLKISLSTDSQHCSSLDISGVNWDKFVKLVRYHRVQGQIYKVVQMYNLNISPDVVAALKTLCKNNGLAALKNTAEVIQLKNQFEQENIPFILFKGITLSQYLYGEPGFRHTGDIDFLIKKEDINRVNELLFRRGYSRIFPGKLLTPKQTEVFINSHHHFEYFQRSKRIRLEAHWDFFFNKQMFNPCLTKIFNEAEELTISGTSLAVLPVKKLILYLMVHGSLHGYFRLFWLYDIAAFYCFEKEIDWKEIYIEAKNLGVERILAQTFNLINILWLVPIPGFMENRSNNFAVDYITGMALKIIPAGENIFDGSSLQRLKKNLYQMLMKKGLAHKFTPLKRQLTSYHDWKFIELPDKLFFLYYLLRPFFIIIALFKKDYFGDTINKTPENDLK